MGIMKRLSSFLQRARGRKPSPTQPEHPSPALPEQVPAPAPQAAPPSQQYNIQASGATLSVALQNQTTSSTVYAYITGQALDNNNALFLLSADGRTPYYPASPGSVGSPLSQNCAIALGSPGNTVTVTIPHIAGGRIWFSIGSPLTFLLNQDQLYANISYVDFVGPPIALTLTTVNSGTQH